MAPLSPSVAALLDVPVPEDLRGSFSRVVNVADKKVHADVYVGRSFAGRADTGWGNPYPVQGTTARARVDALQRYAADMAADATADSRLVALRGQVLGCWCAPLPCHGHLLAGYADGLADATTSWLEQLGTVAASTPRRLLVTGSRVFADRAAMAKALLAQWERWDRDPDAVLVVGDAPGADALAAECWQRAGLTVEVHYADWENLGRRAGPVRNSEMVNSGVDAALAFPIGESRGTRHCIQAAKKAGVPVVVVEN